MQEVVVLGVPREYYYRARYYDQTTGRFLTEDPIGFNGGLNFFEYAENSPTNLFDPLGTKIVVQGDSVSWQIVTVYLCLSPAACSVISELQSSPEVFILNISDKYDQDELSGRWNLYWNPHQALCVKGGIQSPAIQLLHELNHALQWKRNKPRNEEEATQLTNPVAKELGEPTRLNYDDWVGKSTWGFPIPTTGKEGCECQNPRPHKSQK